MVLTTTRLLFDSSICQLFKSMFIPLFKFTIPIAFGDRELEKSTFLLVCISLFYISVKTLINSYIGKLYIMHTYPPLGVRDYATPASVALLDAFDLQVENYYAEDYQTPQVKEFCTRFLKEKGFPPDFSFDPHDDSGDESLHVKAYKCLRQGLCAFEANGGCLDRIEKPLGAREWILAQQVLKEQEIIEQEGRRNEILVAEVETDDGESGNEDNDGEDDGLFLNINASL
jgi:hypothetical protein